MAIVRYDLRVSDNRRYLQHEDGRPFFWFADTAWELFHRLTREEIHQYLATRAQQGFNVVQCVLLAEFEGVTTPNREGKFPLVGNDPAMPDVQPGGYWDLVDEAVEEAAKQGLYMALLPTWGDKINKDWGAGPEIFSPDNARLYGHFVSERYGDKPNVLWVNGGDRDPKDKKGIYRALAEGVRSAENGRHLMTFHPCGGRSSAMDFHADEWLDFNMLQSGHWYYGSRPDKMVEEDWARFPIKPVLDGEPNYENHRPFKDMTLPPFRAYDVRRASYLSVFAGGCGVTYGCHAIWQMASSLFPPVNHPIGNWQQSLPLPGAAHIGLLKNLMLSRPYFDRIPDQDLVLGGPKDGENVVRATRDLAGTYAMFYIPLADAIKPDQAKIKGKVRAWWYDPRTGTSTEIAKPGEVFVPPTAEDWVLVLDSAEAGYGAPGA